MRHGFKALTALVAFVALALMGSPARAIIVVTFDDLVGSGLVPTGYGGIDWQENWNYYSDDQPPYTPSSPPVRVYNNYDKLFVFGELTFLLPDDSTFLGAYFAGNEDNPVYFNLYDASDTLVATSAVLIPTETPQFLASGYGGVVKKVGVVSDVFRVMDDVTYEQGVVPEPGTVALLIGLSATGGLFLVRRRK